MSKCPIDHSHEDVKKKFQEQAEFLPLEIKDLFAVFFKQEHDQEILNEVFHLLKKYDLADEADKQARNKSFLQVLAKAN